MIWGVQKWLTFLKENKERLWMSLNEVRGGVNRSLSSVIAYVGQVFGSRQFIEKQRKEKKLSATFMDLEKMNDKVWK